MDKMEKRDCRAKGEVNLDLRKPRQPHWEHLGCLRIKNGGTLSSPFIQEPPRGGPPCRPERLPTNPHRKAQKTAQRFVPRWKASDPRDVDGLRKDLPNLLPFVEVKTGLPRSVLQTSHAVQRRFRELRRRSRWREMLSYPTRMETVLYSVFTHENLKQGTATPFLLLTPKITRP